MSETSERPPPYQGRPVPSRRRTSLGGSPLGGGDGRRRKERSRRFRTIQVLLIVGIPAAIVFVLAGIRLVGIGKDLEDARKTLDGVELSVQQGNLAQADTQLAVAERKVLSANRHVNGAPELAAVRWLPVVGQNLKAIRDSVGVGLALVGGGRNVLAAARPLADASGHVQVPMRNGQIPLSVVANTQRAADQLATDLPGATERSKSKVLLPIVSDLQKKVYAESGRRKTQFTNIAAGLSLLADMSGANGPRTYLIAVSNEAEMRGTGGMYLSYAVLAAKDGKFTLARQGQIDDLRLKDPATVTAPPDYLTHYDSLKPNLFWRNANLTSDFTAVAPVVEAMYQKATGDKADGVIQIDSDGLAAILAGTGPVNVPQLGEVNAQNAVAVTLNEAYVDFPDRAVRVEFLGDVADAAFKKLVTGDYPSLHPLATSLIKTAAERHVLVHSDSDAAQRAAVQLGVDGSLPIPDVDFATLAVQNLSGNKLDYYLDSRLAISGNRAAGRPATVTATIDLANTAPAGGRPAYIFGPVDASLQPGEYRGEVNLYLPRGARLDGDATGGPILGKAQLSSEEDRTVVSFGVSLLPGQHRTVVLKLLLPSRAGTGYTWQFVPVPRVRPTDVSLDLDLGNRHLRLATKLTQPVTVR